MESKKMAGWQKALIKGGKVAAELIAPDLINLGAKLGTDYIEKQQSLIKIPDLKDVHIDEG